MYAADWTTLSERVATAVGGQMVHVISSSYPCEVVVVWRRPLGKPWHADGTGYEWATHRAWLTEGGEWDLVQGHYMIRDEITALANALARAGVDYQLRDRWKEDDAA